MKKITIVLLLATFVLCSRAEVIATVNGKKITLVYLKKELTKLPEDSRKTYEKDYPGFLEELIIREVLLQEARRLKIDTTSAAKTRIKLDKSKKDIIMIEELLAREVTARISLTEDEMVDFYKAQKGQMQGLTFEQVRPQIEEFLKNQKTQAAVDSYITALLDMARISRNEKWLQSQNAKVKNAIAEALKNKLPTMVDFGAGTCIPCIKMKPIIDELQKEYKDKANILLIDVRDEPALTRKYEIMLIPTQIFYDTNGTEIYRHIGFFPKDSIMILLKKAGLQ